MKILEEASFMNGKTIKWAAIVSNEITGDAEFKLHFTDGTACTIGAWQREGFPTEMRVDEIQS